MYFKYGSYTHTANEVNLVSVSKQTHFSQRSKPMYKTIRMVLEGQFCAGSQSDIEDKIDEILDAYKYGNKDAALYMDDNTRTSHYIDSSQTMGGTRVVDVSFPTGAPGEFATGRTYRIVLEGDIVSIDADGQILFYHDAITTIGAVSSPRFAIIPLRNNQVAFQLIEDVAHQNIIHAGRGIGFDGYVSPPLPLHPAYEQRDRREIKYETPSNIYRNEWWGYESSWRYYYTLPIPWAPGNPGVR